MNQQEFEQRMAEANALLTRRPHYVGGYIDGLRRLYHGPQSGVLQEHETRLGLAYDRYATRNEEGRGYRDGLQGIKPHS